MIVALLSWFAERPRDLEDMASSLALAGVSRLIALDGGYCLFPAAKPRSPEDNYTALCQATSDAGIELTAETPDTVWRGNEIEKRNHLFRLGEQHTTEADWYLVIDGDEVIQTSPPNLPALLAGQPLDVAEVTLIEGKPGQKHARSYPSPRLFRALRGITVAGTHYNYRSVDGRNLWGNAKTQRLAERLPLPDLNVEHRTRFRERKRRTAARQYYRTRDREGVEAGTCDRCGEQAVRTTYGNWRWNPDHDRLIADWTSVCHQHGLDLDAENTRALTDLGHPNPTNPRINFAVGPAR